MDATSNNAPVLVGESAKLPDQDPEARSPNRLIKYTFAILVGLIASFLIVKAQRLSDTSARMLTDFDVFHLVGKLVTEGDGLNAYYSEFLKPLQEALTGSPGFMPWTYPPPFNLLVAPLGMLPVTLAYTIFIGSSLLMFVWVLWTISRSRSVLLTALFVPTFLVIIAAGQNGFLTGALAGLTGLYLARGRPCAGIPLGLLVVKPHLGITLGLFALRDRSGRLAILVGLAVIGFLCILATYLLGTSIWQGFLHAVSEASQKLATAHYPLHRMVSPYASLRTLGAPASLAFAGQAITAAAVSIAVLHIALRSAEPRQGIGVAAAGAVLISPYVYDYDLLVFCIGLAFLLPDIQRFGSSAERLSIYVLSFSSTVVGVLQSRFPSFLIEGSPPTIAGILMTVCFLVLWRLIARVQGRRKHHLDSVQV